MTLRASLSTAHGLAVSDLTVSYNRIPALHHIAFEVGCGQCVALLGPNGAGKSTLLKALAGLLPRETGRIAFHGREVQGATQDFAYLPQREAIDWDFPTTVHGLVEMGRYLRVGWWRGYGREDEKAVDAAIAAMQLGPLAQRQISALSSPARWPSRRTSFCSMNLSPASTNRRRTISSSSSASCAIRAN